MQVEIQKEPLCTIIKKPFDAEWVRQQLVLGNDVRTETNQGRTRHIENFTVIDLRRAYHGYDRETLSPFTLTETSFKHTITILPPLPRHPKPEDAALLYRYMSEGLQICGICVHDWDGGIRKTKEVSNRRIIGHLLDGSLEEITHCIDTEGNKHNIAIKE